VRRRSALSDAIVRGVTDTLGYGNDAVSVRFEEVPAGEWSARVYGPDIQDRWAELTKLPGYDPGAKRQAEPAIMEK
jgi:4-oxalocrotonate tautomerase